MSFTTGGGGGGRDGTNPSSPTQGLADSLRSINNQQSALVEMFRSLLRKAQESQQFEKTPDQTTALVINFDGAGAALVPGMGGAPLIPPGGYRILGIHMASGVWNPLTLTIEPIICTAVVDIRFATAGLWASGTSPIYPDATSPITLVNQSEVDIDTSLWVQNLQPGDLLVYTLQSFFGTATVLTVTLNLRRLNLIGVGVDQVTDDPGTAFTDAAGNPFEVRA